MSIPPTSQGQPPESPLRAGTGKTKKRKRPIPVRKTKKKQAPAPTAPQDTTYDRVKEVATGVFLACLLVSAFFVPIPLILRWSALQGLPKFSSPLPFPNATLPRQTRDLLPKAPSPSVPYQEPVYTPQESLTPAANIRGVHNKLSFTVSVLDAYEKGDIMRVSDLLDKECEAFFQKDGCRYIKDYLPNHGTKIGEKMLKRFKDEPLQKKRRL